MLTPSQATRIVQRFPWPPGICRPTFVRADMIENAFRCLLGRGPHHSWAVARAPTPEAALRWAIDEWLEFHGGTPEPASITQARQHAHRSLTN